MSTVDESDDRDEDPESQASSDLFAEEPFDLFQTRISYHFSRIISLPSTQTSLLLVRRRRGGAFNRITELAVNTSENRDGENPNVNRTTIRYIWRTPRFRSNDVTRSALILRHLGRHAPLIPVPTVLSFSATDEVLSDRYILMNHLAGIDLVSVLSYGSLGLIQRLIMAERVAEMIADVHGIRLPGQEGLIGDLCVEGEGVEGGYGMGQNLSGFQKSKQEEEEHLVIKTFPLDHALDHDSATSPNASDQLSTTPDTLRSFILARFQLHINHARVRKNGVVEKTYLRLLKVAETLLDPDQLPSLDVMCQSVLVHGDLTPRNILLRVERSEDEGDDGDRATPGEGEGLEIQPEIEDLGIGSELGNGEHHSAWSGSCSCPSPSPPAIKAIMAQTSSPPRPFISPGVVKITGVLDWDVIEALPPLAAYVSPNWLWNPNHPESSKTSTYDDEDDPDPDHGIDEMDPTDALVRARFITSIEERIPGYMQTVRQSRRFGIKKLVGFARSRVSSTWELRGVEALERLSEKMRQERG